MQKSIVKRIVSTAISGIMGLSIIPFDGIALRSNAVDYTPPDIGSDLLQISEKQAADTANILNGDVNGDGVIDDKDSKSVLKVKLSDCPQADVNADGKLDQTDADMINSYTTGEINYFPVGTYYDESPGYLTRGEWIHKLVEGFEMSAASGSELQEFYTDLTDYEYGSEITLAANFGVFDVLGDKFNPNEYVTRDFAAHTMNFCLGFPNDVAISFTDADAVYYDGDAQVAVNKGWFALENKEFHPSLYVKATESDIAFKDMHDTYKSTQIDETHKDVVEYADNVIRMTDAKSASIDGTTVKVTGSSKTVNDGDNFTFVVDGVEIIRKATDAWLDEDSNTWTIETEDADEASVISCDVEGYAVIDYDNIEVLHPAAASLMVNGKSLKYAPKPATSSGNSFSKTIPLGDTSFKISGSINNINVPYEWDKLSKFYLGFEADAQVSGTLAAKLAAEKTGSIDLLSIPVWGTAGFSANVVASATVSVSGELTLTFSCSMNAGIEWTLKNGFRTVKNFTNQRLTMQASATEKLGVQCAVSGKFFSKELARIYVGLGEKGTLSTVSSTDMPVTCTQLTGYLYVEVGYKVDLILAKFENSWEVINANNSPLRINLHWEDGKLVDQCTQGLGYKSQASGSNGGGASGGYVSGYGYGTGYAGGTHGPAWLGKYYASTIAFKELEPALVISEDRMLTDDLEVETDLIIRAKLDLNGHKLTADKNVYVGDIYDGDDGYWGNTGELVINKGTANIKGNLSEIDGSNIVMNNKTDKICVDGNVDLNGGTSFTAGTIEIKGDISGRLDSSDMHIVLLSGTGNQNISGNGINANVLDINNSDSRTITVDSTLRADSSTTIDGKTLHLICNESRNDESYVSVAKLNADKLIIDGNVTLGNLEYRGSEITINGDLLGSDSITLNKTSVTINGDATTNGDFTLNGSNVTATGDYHHNGFLYMKNKNDKLNVGGDLHLEGTGDSIQDGVIDVKGDIRLNHVIHTYIFERYNELGGNNKLVLSGEDDVTIYMDGGRFNDIDFQNSDKRILNTDDTFRATSINCGTNPLNISTRNGVLELGAVTCSDFKVTGDSTIIGETKFNCSSITFDGDLTSGNSWDYTNINLNGKPTNVNGVLTCNDELNLSGAVLNVDDLTLNGRLYFGKGTVNVKGDMTISSGGLYMQDEKDKLSIAGDFNITRDDYVNSPAIKCGTIECGGDITANGGASCLKNCGTATFILNGKEDQTISISSPHSDYGEPFFNALNISNSGDRKIILKGHLIATELSADSATLNIESNGGIINGAKIKCDLNITGNLVLERVDDYYEDTCVFDLNGHNVDINGSLYQHSGELALNNGKLNITGDYLIVRDEDSAAQNVSDGKLNMTHANDNVIVGGKFATMTNVDHSELLTAGIMEIKGDFCQYDDGTEFAFPASGTHKVILSGTDIQNITFESYDSSHFNNVELTQDPLQYVFSDDPCWNNLDQGTDPVPSTTGDVNEDGSIDLKDVVVMRRILAGGWEITYNEAACDVNGDSSFDLKDVVYLRRYLAGGWDIKLA